MGLSRKFYLEIYIVENLCFFFLFLVYFIFLKWCVYRLFYFLVWNIYILVLLLVINWFFKFVVLKMMFLILYLFNLNKEVVII